MRPLDSLSRFGAAESSVSRKPDAQDMMLVAALAAMLSLPFLVPVHRLPIPSFYEEASALALGLFAVVLAGIRKNFAVPAIAPWIAALGLLMFVQPLFLPVASPELAWMQGLCALWAAAMMCVGAGLRREDAAGHTATILAVAILAAVLISAVASWLVPHRLAFLHQPNLHANYQVVGLSCVAFLWMSGRLPVWAATGAMALIGSSLVIGASRASLLELAWVASIYAGWSVGRVQPQHSRAAWVIAGAILLMVAGVLLLPESVSGILLAKVANTFHSRELHVRLVEWEAALRIGWSAPWFGIGAGGYSAAQFATPTPWAGAVPMQVEINAHNAVLHLFAETGFVGALLAVAGVALWLVRALRALRGMTLWHAWAVAGAGIQFVHGMVEYPLWNVEFLGVAALLAGMGDPRRSMFSPGKAARWVWSTAGVAALALVAWTTVMFGHVQAYWAGRGAPAEAVEAARRSLLRPYIDVALALAMPLDGRDLDQKIAFNDRVVRTWPLRPVVQRHIAWLAMAGDSGRAEQLIRHMMRLEPASIVELEQLLAQLSTTDLPEDAPLRRHVRALAQRQSKSADENSLTPEG